MIGSVAHSYGCPGIRVSLARERMSRAGHIDVLPRPAERAIAECRDES